MEHFHPLWFLWVRANCVNCSKSEIGLVLYSEQSDTNSRESQPYHTLRNCSINEWSRQVVGKLISNNIWNNLRVKCRITKFVNWYSIIFETRYRQIVLITQSQTIWTCVIFENTPLLWRWKWQVDNYIVAIYFTSWKVLRSE